MTALTCLSPGTLRSGQRGDCSSILRPIIGGQSARHRRPVGPSQEASPSPLRLGRICSFAHQMVKLLVDAASSF